MYRFSLFKRCILRILLLKIKYDTFIQWNVLKDRKAQVYLSIVKNVQNSLLNGRGAGYKSMCSMVPYRYINFHENNQYGTQKCYDNFFFLSGRLVVMKLFSLFELCMLSHYLKIQGRQKREVIKKFTSFFLIYLIWLNIENQQVY